MFPELRKVVKTTQTAAMCMLCAAFIHDWHRTVGMPNVNVTQGVILDWSSH